MKRLLIALLALTGTCDAALLTLNPNGDYAAELYPVPTRAHYLNVNDWVDTDTTYNGATATQVIQRDGYTLDDHGTVSGIINSVTVYYRMQVTNGST